MNNELILSLIKNNIEEIKNLINHFQNKESDLQDGFPLLDSRLNSLNKDIEILRSNLNKNNIVSEIPSQCIHAESPTTSTVKIENKEETKVEEIENKLHLASIETDVKKMTSIDSESLLKEQASCKTTQNSTTLNDSLQSDNTSHYLQENLNKTKLTNIQSAIGINDQFLFIRELFDNNTEEYKASINYINSQDNYDETISHLKKSQQWDHENDTVIQFFNLIKRRFE